jgi:hypothetical protein
VRIVLYSKQTGEIMTTQATRQGVKTMFRILGSFKRCNMDVSHYQFAGTTSKNEEESVKNGVAMNFLQTPLSEYLNTKKGEC